MKAFLIDHSHGAAIVLAEDQESARAMGDALGDVTSVHPFEVPMVLAIERVEDGEVDEEYLCVAITATDEWPYEDAVLAELQRHHIALDESDYGDEETSDPEATPPTTPSEIPLPQNVSVLRIANLHTESTAYPPGLKRLRDPGLYCSYFENSRGEQLVFHYDYASESGILYIGGEDWATYKIRFSGGETEDCLIKVLVDPEDGELDLDHAERLWLLSCGYAVQQVSASRRGLRVPQGNNPAHTQN